MIISLATALIRVTIFWYLLGFLVLFLGDPAWVDAIFNRLLAYPWVPYFEAAGLGTAAAVQFRLLTHWTVPVAILWVVSLCIGALIAEVQCQMSMAKQRRTLQPRGTFWGVYVSERSLGALPISTTPPLTGKSVSLSRAGGGDKKTVSVQLQGAIKEAVKLLTAPEKQLAEELLQLLLQAPDHYAGLGHGVGLLEHTLNVVTEAAPKVTSEFRLPLLAALSHDIGKLITFQPDGQGGWLRKGLHSRESARILATLPAFKELPDLHQRALLLAVKYDHAPSKMPDLRGERDATTLAMRTISALAHADRKATADEKERHLERLKPEDLLWKDFVDFLREAPVVQRGKKGAANQVNNPPDSPYLFLYEAPWRDAAVRRLPAEVAAALDLTRRDAGKMAKYTRILVDCLRKEGLLVESYLKKDEHDVVQELRVNDANPLWDIQSGTGEKAVVLRGILVLKADELWKKLNYRISVKSPFPVQILAPNANVDGKVNDAPKANRNEPPGPDVSDGMKVTDIANPDAMEALGLASAPTDGSSSPKPKGRGRSFRSPAPEKDDSIFGLQPGKAQKHKVDEAASEAPPAPMLEAAIGSSQASQEEQERAELEAALSSSEVFTGEALDEPEQPSEAMSGAMDFLTQMSALPEPSQAQGEEATSEPTQERVQPEADEPQPAETAKKPGTATNPIVEETPTPKESAPATELSRAEKREGLALADAAAVELYPHLKVGDKFYTEHSRAVQTGLKKPGSRYKGDAKDKGLDLTEQNPRRAKRRTFT